MGRRLVSRVAVLVVLVAALAGCQRRSALYCQNHPGDPACEAEGCENDTMCPNRRCDTASGTCVDCLTSLDCRDELKPVCKLDTMQCLGCAQDADCPDQVCLEDGSCPAAGTVLFASANAAAGNPCTRMAPCQLAEAIGKIDATHTVVRLLAGTYNEAITLPDVGVPYVISGEHVEGAPTSIIAAPSGSGQDTVAVDGADVGIEYLELRDADGDGLHVRNGASVRAHHLLLRNNAQSGVDASGGKLTLTESFVTQNHDGGAKVADADVSIENNWFVLNGSTLQTAKGLHVETSTGVVRFNTIVDNFQGTGGNDPPGFLCDGSIVAEANLVTDNLHGAMTTSFPAQARATGGCSLGEGPRASYTMPGMMGDDALLFTGVTPEWGSFHLAPMAPPQILNVVGFDCMGVDADGEPRPMGAACDIGADELRE